VGDNVVVALADVSFDVCAEEFVVVLGPSGCGKTTLLNMIGALDSPTEGRVVVAGRDITRSSRKELFEFRRHGVSFVFQTFNLFPALTALENAEFGADVAGRPNPLLSRLRCSNASDSSTSATASRSSTHADRPWDVPARPRHAAGHRHPLEPDAFRRLRQRRGRHGPRAVGPREPHLRRTRIHT